MKSLPIEEVSPAADIHFIGQGLAITATRHIFFSPRHLFETTR